MLRAGGLLFAAAISRFAALLDVVLRVDRLHEPEVLAAVFASVETDVFAGDAFGFTTAYFHRPLELTAEVAEAGFADVRLLNVEGPGFLAGDLRERWQDPSRARRFSPRHG